MNDWNLIRAVHSYITKIPPHIVDLIAVEEILRLYAVGVGAVGISELVELDLEYIKEVLNEYYFEPIREKTLIYNPLKYYRESEGILNDFIVLCFTFESEEELYDTYLICKYYEKYKKELESYE